MPLLLGVGGGFLCLPVPALDHGVLTGCPCDTLAWSAATDIGLALVPWFMIWPLQMKRAEKIGLGLVMSLGIGCVLICVFP
ncbi:hypothetical protein B0T24DRAFT_618585 [Lasiosphaeria ovina]|uniref:Uncharacterized protein n=1 Tax=Lasiosphaeria ovina TaxID=92902 RepID=A0AAE0KH09_9PEZI|nr:hypothetical protein B0T24DRAFT_618585 [Lasiosphaeria ovina]